jgi:uroporphyrinogen decarboxylase
MTSRQRAEAAMRGGRPDRVPVVPLIDNSYAAACLGVPVSECFLKPEVHARALAAALERHPGIDGLSINIGLTESVLTDLRRTSDGYLATTTDGCVWNIPWNDVGTPASRSVDSFGDGRLRSADVLKPHILDTLRHLPAEILERYDISVGLTGPFSQVLFMMGLDRALPALIEEPAALKDAVEARIPFALRWAEEAAALGAPSVWIGEGFASSSLISPVQFAEFVLPAEQRVTARLRELGVPSVLHICGKATGSLESIAQSGSDCFEADWQVDLAEARDRFRGRVALKGNLHTTHLLHASPEQIYTEARAVLEQARAGEGSFILSSGCALGRDTPPENVEAMVRAAQDYGRP